jgi:hypothetical protein
VTIIIQQERPGHPRPTHFTKSLANYYGNQKKPQIEYVSVQQAIEQAGSGKGGKGSMTGCDTCRFKGYTYDDRVLPGQIYCQKVEEMVRKHEVGFCHFRLPVGISLCGDSV